MTATPPADTTVFDVAAGDDDESLRQIGEVADELGLSQKTIRHYDEVGLVPPSARTVGGFRLYTAADVDRLRLIMVMKPLGFALEEMGVLLDTLHESSDQNGNRIDRAERLAAFAVLVEHRCERLRGQLQAGQSFAAMLRHLAASSSPS